MSDQSGEEINRCVACIRPEYAVGIMFEYPGRPDHHICGGCGTALEVIE